MVVIYCHGYTCSRGLAELASWAQVSRTDTGMQWATKARYTLARSLQSRQVVLTLIFRNR